MVFHPLGKNSGRYSGPLEQVDAIQVHIANQDPTLVSKPQWQDIANNLYILSSQASAAPTLLAYGTCGCVSALRIIQFYCSAFSRQMSYSRAVVS